MEKVEPFPGLTGDAGPIAAGVGSEEVVVSTGRACLTGGIGVTREAEGLTEVEGVTEFEGVTEAEGVTEGDGETETKEVTDWLGLVDVDGVTDVDVLADVEGVINGWDGDGCVGGLGTGGRGELRGGGGGGREDRGPAGVGCG